MANVGSLAIDGEHAQGGDALSFTIVGEARTDFSTWLLDGLKAYLRQKGYAFHHTPPPNIRLVLNAIDPDNPQPYRRKAQATFVVSVTEINEKPDNVLQFAYPKLVRSLSNLLVLVIHTDEGTETHFITPEQGYYQLKASVDDIEAYFAEFYARLEPIATSQLIIDNEFHTDLPEELWDGDEFTKQLFWAGKKLDAFNLLPAPFPLDEVLSPRDMRHLQRLYSMGGLSYGNLSARRDADTFWMSASGVDKSNMHKVGEHVLLVKGFDPERGVMLLSVPPNIKPRRVSVDAIEHYLIYREHPQVGAIVHVHAWMDNIPATEMNYPCGTLQLAQAVAELVRQADDPARAVIGLKNHGLTITGTSLEDIFERIDGKIIPQVPMS